MEDYYFRLVCVNDTDPIEFCVLEDKNVKTLEEAHDFVLKNINKHISQKTKWLLIPINKKSVSNIINL